MADIIRSQPITGRSLDWPALAGNHKLVDCDAGYKIVVVGLVVNANGNIAVAFQDEHQSFATFYLQAGMNVVLPPANRGWFTALAGDDVYMGFNVAGVNVGGYILYQLVPAGFEP